MVIIDLIPIDVFRKRSCAGCDCFARADSSEIMSSALLISCCCMHRSVGQSNDGMLHIADLETICHAVNLAKVYRQRLEKVALYTIRRQLFLSVVVLNLNAI